MHKKIENNNREFMISVDLNVSGEKTPGGKVTHAVSVREINGAYSQTYEVEDSSLKEELQRIERETLAVSITPVSPAEKILTELGYK